MSYRGPQFIRISFQGPRDNFPGFRIEQLETCAVSFQGFSYSDPWESKWGDAAPEAQWATHWTCEVWDLNSLDRTVHTSPYAPGRAMTVREYDWLMGALKRACKNGLEHTPNL